MVHKAAVKMGGRLSMFILTVYVVAMLGGTANAAEEGNVRATASWVAEGQYFQVGEDQALFVGVFTGMMYVETSEHTMDAAQLICPAMIEIALDSGKQSGEGRCIITARDGDRVYATWLCAGEHFAGCAGSFTLAGGTGRFKGITGNSAFTVRSQVAELAASAGAESVHGSASGVAVWPALTYKIP